MNEQYQIDQKDAKWLALALPSKKMRQICKPSLNFVTVLKCNGIHMAGTTDGHRLHAVEVSDTIPDGAYSVDAKTGALTPANLGKERPLDWFVIVTPKKEYTVACAEPSAETVRQAPGVKVYQLSKNPGYFADAKLMDHALSIETPHKISVKRRVGTAIRIDFTGSDKVRFAFIMPVHWTPS